MLKSSKHRCSCYSQQYDSFLYGLRRDAPSTERVLLERLLNVLSRAAAHKNKNPQRLWAESEKPEWWAEVTDLQWKNPREHPKDNKQSLKKKIDILESQLKKRGMMTKELQEELTIHRESKKTDLELKSDFEAIISKASGLHFMLDKVCSKMGQSRIISDKMATYIRETSGCIEKVHKLISSLQKQVEAREEKKSDLWEAMGVSKHQQTTHDDLVTDALPFDLEMMDGLPDDLAEIFSANPASLYQPPTPAATLSPESDMTELLSPLPPLSPPSVSAHRSKSYSSPASSNISPPPTAKPNLQPTFQRSLSQPKSEETEPQSLNMLEVNEMRRVQLLYPVISKRTWLQSADKEEDPERGKARVKSPRTVPIVEGGSSRDVIVIDDGDDLPYITVPTSVSERGSGKDRRSVAETETTLFGHFSKHRRPRSYGDSFLRSKHKPYTLPAPSKQQHSASASDHFLPLPFFGTPKPSATAVAHPDTTDPLIGSSGVKVTGTSKVKVSPADDVELPWEVVEDVGDYVLEDFLEKRTTPTHRVNPKDTSGVHELAEKTKSLSVEDLHPSVTESFMTGGFPSPKLGRSIDVGYTSYTPFPTTHTRKLSQKPSTVTRDPAKRQTSVVMATEGGGGGGEAGYLTLDVESLEEASSPAYIPPLLTVKSRHVPRTEGSGESSLSRAIGDLGTIL